MVSRGGKSNPSSRGTSPQKFGNQSPKKPQPSRTPPDRRIRSNSPRSRGNSPAKNGNVLLRSSRGSESGSIERLTESRDSNRIISRCNQEEDNINVVVRVRPLNQKEIKAGDEFAVQFPGHGQVLVDSIPNGGSAQLKHKLFSYNVVFEPAATQEDVLQFSGMRRLIEMAVEGFRCTAFCYGQTGSGKTHTLTGPPKLFEKKPVRYSDSHGLIFRSFLYLFKLLAEKPDVHFILKASFLEIYNEKVIDLLNPGSARKPLQVRWSKKARGFFVENLFTVDCEELDDLTAVLEEGIRNRSVGSHNMNEYSSRSHTILTVYITSEQQAEKGVFISRTGKINFVDLAGSEMTKKTQSEGKTLEEANNINKSLMVLGYCIASLSDSKRKNNHIPYRDSQLTKLLADSLAGNGVTLMIACISPAKSNLTETLNTLRYAARAKKITTKPIVLMDPREALILSLQREVGVLQAENEHLRSVLHLGDTLPEKRIIATPPQIDLEKLPELEGPQLVELVKLYAAENEALRKENMELFISREIFLRDQELVCRENERLLKKLEDVNSVCCRSPIVPAKPSLSADTLSRSTVDLNLTNSNVWTNPLNASFQSLNRTVLPEAIQKELDKRRIGTNLQEQGHRRHNSLDDLTATTNPLRGKSSKSANSNNSQTTKMSTDRRFSVAKNSNVNKANSVEVSSPISLPDSDQNTNTPPSTTNSNNVHEVDNKHANNSEIFGSAVSLDDSQNGF